MGHTAGAQQRHTCSRSAHPSSQVCSGGVTDPPRWPSLNPVPFSSPQSQALSHPGQLCLPVLPQAPPSGPGPTWRGRHGLQAGVGTSVVAAAPVPRALRVSLAAHGLAGAGGHRPRGRRAAVGSGLPGAAGRARLLGLRGEGGVSNSGRVPARRERAREGPVRPGEKQQAGRARLRGRLRGSEKTMFLFITAGKK